MTMSIQEACHAIVQWAVVEAAEALQQYSEVLVKVEVETGIVSVEEESSVGLVTMKQQH
jgi:hypothetical protein